MDQALETHVAQGGVHPVLPEVPGVPDRGVQARAEHQIQVDQDLLLLRGVHADQVLFLQGATGAADLCFCSMQPATRGKGVPPPTRAAGEGRGGRREVLGHAEGALGAPPPDGGKGKDHYKGKEGATGRRGPSLTQRLPGRGVMSVMEQMEEEMIREEEIA